MLNRLRWLLRYLLAEEDGILGKAMVWQAPRIFSFTAATNAALLTNSDTTLFIADADYELESVAEAHAIAGDDAGAVTLDIKKCTGTQAPSAGTTMLASTFNLKSTANTVVRKDRSNGGLSTTRTVTQITKGDRVCADFSGTLATLAGFCVTLVLIPTRRRPAW